MWSENLKKKLTGVFRVYDDIDEGFAVYNKDDDNTPSPNGGGNDYTDDVPLVADAGYKTPAIA